MFSIMININDLIIVLILVPLTSIITISVIKFVRSYYKFDKKMALFLSNSTYSENAVVTAWQMIDEYTSNSHAISSYSLSDRLALELICKKNGIDLDSTVIKNVRREVIQDVSHRIEGEGEEAKIIPFEPITRKDMADLRSCSRQMTTVRAEARMMSFDHYSVLCPESKRYKCSLEMVDDLKAAYSPLSSVTFEVLYDYCKRETSINIVTCETANCIIGSILMYLHWAKEQRRSLNGRLSL